MYLVACMASIPLAFVTLKFFGQKQNLNNTCAAVIPVFCKHFIVDTQPTINIVGLTSRDFTFIENAVLGNIKSLLYVGLNSHVVMNLACGDQVTLNEIVDMLKEITNKEISANYGSERKGDVSH